MIQLSAELADAIRKEGEKAYPHECCGILLGKEKPGLQSEDTERAAEALVPIENAREAEEQYHRFKIEPEDFMQAEKEARRRNLDVLGFYHSHPDHPARPSDFDREHALPFYSYVIVSVEQGRAKDLTSWELAPDRSAFSEEAINGGKIWP